VTTEGNLFEYHGNANQTAIVVDGVPISINVVGSQDQETKKRLRVNLGWRNHPDDTQSMTVLKGQPAAACRIKSSMEQFLITTKSGKNRLGLRSGHPTQTLTFVITHWFFLSAITYGQGNKWSKFLNLVNGADW